MSLADRMAESSPEEPQDFVPRTEYDGGSGYIQTGAMEAPPGDYDALLREFGYNPEVVQIVGHPRVSRWQQRSRIRGTSDYETTWLSAYKFAISACGLSVDLPALYAEVGKTKNKQISHEVDQATIVVCWADIQTGKVDHLGGVRELLERLEEKRSRLADYLKKERFDHIVIADVGDIIEGFSNFPAQHRTNGLSLMDQVDVAATEFWKTIKLCAKYASVDVLSIPSNHCAWRREGKNAGKPTDDWGLHISVRLERLNEEVGLPVTFHRPQDWKEFLVHDIRGTVLGLAHGHQASNPNGIIPFWQKVGHGSELALADILLTGHFHFLSVRASGRNPYTGKARYHIQAPTLDNGSAWVANKMGEDGDPGLAVFRINDDGLSGLRVL
jgi:ribosomal protein S15P/S13E